MLETFVQVAASPVELGLIGAVAPRRVQLLPMGRIDMRDGRGPYYLRDRAHADRVVAATRQYLGSADFMFDYDHQALAAAKQDGSTAPASGWAKAANLIVEDDGIYADQINWTPAAARMIVAREYRYLSPLFLAAKATGDVLQLKNVALVNMPAIDMPAIAAGLSDRVAPILTPEERWVADKLGIPHDDFLGNREGSSPAYKPNPSDEAVLPEETQIWARTGISKAAWAAGKAIGLTADEMYVCSRFHISHEDFAAEKAKEALG